MQEEAASRSLRLFLKGGGGAQKKDTKRNIPRFDRIQNQAGRLRHDYHVIFHACPFASGMGGRVSALALRACCSAPSLCPEGEEEEEEEGSYFGGGG